MRIIWFVILILFLSLSTEASKVYEKQPDASYQLVLSDTLPILVEYDAVPSYVVLGTILSEKPTIIDQLYLSNNPTDILTNDAMLKLSATCAQRKLNVLAKSDNVLGPANTNFFVQEFQTNDDFTAALWAGGAFSNAGIPLIDISGNQDDALLQNSLISTLGVTDSTGSTSLNQLNNLFNYGKVLRSIPADEETTYNLCLLIQYFGWSLVSLVFTDTDYGISGALSFAKYADQFNINITCYQVFPAFNSTYNIENNIDCISNSDARVSIVWSDFNSSLEIVEKYQTSGKLSKQIIIGSNEFLIGWGIQVKQYLQNSSLYSGLVSFMKSALFATPSPGPFTELTTCINEVNYNGSSDSLFQEVWRNVFHCELVSYEGGATNPPSDGTEYCSGGFTAGYDKNCLCPRFIPFQYSTNYSTANYGYDNFLSTYNAISLIASNCTAVSEVLGRNFCTPNATWNSIDLQKIMRSQTILGLTGTVGYNLNNALYSNYEFAQINSDGTAQTIGFHYENETLQIDENLVYWKNGSKPISEFSEELQPQLPSVSLSIIMVTFASLVVCFVIWLLVLLIWYRDEKPIKQTSFLLSLLMLLGVLLVSTSQIFWNIRVQSPLTCIVKVPLLVIGGCLLKGSLIAKLLRIYAIFGSKSSHINSNENGRKMNINYRLIKDSFLLWIPTILVAIGLILVILYMTVTGYPRPTTRYNRTGQLISRCQVPVEGVQLAFLLTLIIYQAILLATIIILSMLTRGIENSYSEAKGLSFIANFRLVVFYLFTTVYYQWSNVGNHTSTRQLLVRFTGITLLVLNIIIALFISKLYKAHKEYHSRAQTKQNDLERLQRLADPCVFTTDYSVSGSSIEYNGEDEDGSIVN